jgi:hypothetical protein
MVKLGDADKAGPSAAFLTPDERVPASIRELLVEADGCVAGGFFTGATACAQRAVDALLKLEKAEGATHEARIKSLSDKTPGLPQILVTVLTQLGDVSAKDTAKLTSSTLQLLLTTLKAVAYEIYVVAPERSDRLQHIRRLLDATERKPAAAAAGSPAAAAPAPAVPAAAGAPHA